MRILLAASLAAAALAVASLAAADAADPAAEHTRTQATMPLSGDA